MTRTKMTDDEFIAWVNSLTVDPASVVMLAVEDEPALVRVNEQRYTFTTVSGLRGACEWGDGHWYAYDPRWGRDETLHTGATPREAAEDAIRSWVAMRQEMAS